MSNSLEHYGVKGMRWGVVNSPKPSPTKAKSVKKKADRPSIKTRNALINGREATKLLKAADTFDKSASELRAKAKASDSIFKKAGSNLQAKSLEKQAAINRQEAEKYKKAKLTDTQRAVLVGAAVVAGTLVVGYYGGKKLKQLQLAGKLGGDVAVEKQAQQASERFKKNLTDFGHPFKRNEEFAAASSPQEILDKVSKSINPSYNKPGGVMNCRRCTFAYELRRRGYDVTATGSPYGVGQSETGLVNALINGDTNLFSTASMSTFAGSASGGIRERAIKPDLRSYTAFTDRVSKIDDLRGALLKQPNGARGEVVFDMNLFAHSMSYEIIGGVPHIFDNQKGKMYEVSQAGMAELTGKWGIPSVVDITRLDDVNLDFEFLNNWAES